jgi:hypothetical protein
VSVSANTTFTFTVSATDGWSSISRTFSINITNNTQPVWTTPAGSLATLNAGQSVPVSIVATDSDGLPQPISYSVVSGSLPNGITLNSSTGAFTGVAENLTSTITYTFTVRATDSVEFADRQFSITILTAEYQIAGALKLDGANDYLTKSVTTTGNRQKWTVSLWTKRSKLHDAQMFLSAGVGNDYTALQFGPETNASINAPYTNYITVRWTVSNSMVCLLTTTDRFIDTSKWYHVVVSVDTTQSVSSDRVKVYVDGVKQSLSGTYPPQYSQSNRFLESGYSIFPGQLGVGWGGTSYFYDGYLSELSIIDGQTLPPYVFGKFNTTNKWVPKAVEVYGANVRSTVNDTNTHGDITSVDRSWSLTNGDIVSTIELYSTTASIGKFKIVQRTSAGNYTVLQTVNYYHSGGGWKSFGIPSFNVPETGTYYVAVYQPNTITGGLAIGASVSYIGGDAINSFTMTESNAAHIPSIGVKYGVSTNIANMGTAIASGGHSNSLFQIYYINNGVSDPNFSTGYGYDYNSWSTESTTGWVGVDFGANKTITAYGIMPYYHDPLGGGGYSNNIQSWTFEGWNGSSWVVLDTRTNIGSTTVFRIGDSYIFPLSTTTTLISYSTGTVFGNYDHSSGGGNAVLFNGTTSAPWGSQAAALQQSAGVYGFIGKDYTSSGGRAITQAKAYATSDSGFGQLFGSITVDLQYADTQQGPWTTIASTTAPDANNSVATITVSGSAPTKNCWRLYITNVGNYGKLVEVQFYETSTSATYSKYRLNGTSRGGYICLAELMLYSDISSMHYGVNGCRLEFNNSNVGLDTSGRGNNFTPTSLTSADLVSDTPTTNYTTLNPLDDNSTYSTGTLSNGNLTLTSSNDDSFSGTIFVNSGKWYWEMKSTSGYGLPGVVQGYYRITGTDYKTYSYHLVSGNKVERYPGVSNLTGYGSVVNTGETVGIKLDLDNGTVEFLKSNVSQGIAFTGLTGWWAPIAYTGPGTDVFNFGQTSFSYSIPSGYKALCMANIPTFTDNPSSHFKAVSWTGNGSSQTITTGFNPDLMWVKARNASYNHIVIDKIRGLSNYINTNTTTSENTDATMITSTHSTGFTVGSSVNTNQSSVSYVGWCWKAGTSTTNTSGSITSQVSANQTSGFSMVKYTGNGANSTIGHGLNDIPKFMMVRGGTGYQMPSSTTTLNPSVTTGGTLSNNNLTFTSNGAGVYSLSTTGVSIGTKYVFEAKCTASGRNGQFVGFCDAASPSHMATADFRSYKNGHSWMGGGEFDGLNPTYSYANQQRYINSYTFAVNDVIGVVLETNGSTSYYKNGVLITNSASLSGISNLTNDRQWYAFVSQANADAGATWDVRFDPSQMTYYSSYGGANPLGSSATPLPNLAWQVYHASIGPNYRGMLNNTPAFDAQPTIWNNTVPSSTTFTVGTSAQINGLSTQYIAYCWTEIPGYSRFGIYGGNGASTNGPFVHCGFRPAFVMVKSSSAGDNWQIHDNTRNSYNPYNLTLRANATDQEFTAYYIDFTSNGFKWYSGGGDGNQSGQSYIFAAFAEKPFK